MRAIAVIGLSTAIYILVGTAAAQDPDNEQKRFKAVDSQVDTAQLEKAVALKRPPLVLPSITRLVARLRIADHSALNAQLRKSRQVIAFWRNPERQWLRAPRARKCWEVPWQRSCTMARSSLRLHTQLAQMAQERLWRELPLTNDWQTAVRIAQRVYPNTASWLLSCSASEGGWGRWVPNNEGSGVGGWMQMFESTFWRMWGAASDDLEQRGFVVPEGTASWYSPVGQALASAWGLTHGRRGEWHGAGC